MARSPERFRYLELICTVARPAICALWFGCLAMSHPALAQNTSQESGAAQIEQRIQPSKKSAPEVEQPQIDVAPGKPAARMGDRSAFVLSAVVIQGATAIPAADLAPIYKTYLAKKISELEIQEIAEAITKAYRDAGYVFSQADVLPQEIIGGVLTIVVTEGFVESLRFDGDAMAGRGIIDGYMAPVLAERPVRLKTIERAMLLVNDLPGVSVADTSITAGASPGGQVLNITLRVKQADADLYLDNRGTPSAGRLQTWVAGAANGLSGPGSRLQIGVFTVPDKPEELVYAAGTWSQPVTDAGTIAELSVSGSVANAGADLAESATESDSLRVKVSLRHPVLRRRLDSLWVVGEFDYYNLNEESFGTVNYEDRTRTARIGIEYFRPEILNGSFFANAVYARGVDVFGASNPGNGELSRSDGRSSFDKVTLEIRRLQKVVGGFAILTQAKGQWANQPLLSGAEFSLGGSQYGRAFDYGELTGELGAGGLIEIRYTGKKPTDWLDSYDLYGFYDAGAVWQDIGGSQFLSSAGVGMRSAFKHGIVADIQAARPLNRRVSTEGDKDIRVLFSLGAGF